jgi:hypothetical protein
VIVSASAVLTRTVLLLIRVRLPDDGQRVPHSARIARIRHLGQPLQQAGHLLGPDVEVLSELVKGERYRG